MPKIEALLNNPPFVFGCQSVLLGRFYYWIYKRDQAWWAKQKQKDDESNRKFKKRELEREQKWEQQMGQSRKERDREFERGAAETDQLLDDWKRKLKQDNAEIDRECREARYAFSKQFRENSQLIWANLTTCANMFEFERVFREWREQQQQQHEVMDSL